MFPILYCYICMNIKNSVFYITQCQGALVFCRHVCISCQRRLEPSTSQEGCLSARIIFLPSFIRIPRQLTKLPRRNSIVPQFSSLMSRLTLLSICYLKDVANWFIIITLANNPDMKNWLAFFILFATNRFYWIYFSSLKFDWKRDEELTCRINLVKRLLFFNLLYKKTYL